MRITRIAVVVAPAFALAALLAIPGATRGEDRGLTLTAAQSETGTVSGTVVDKDGKAVANAEVGVYKPRERRQGQGGGGGAGGGTDQKLTQPAPGGGEGQGQQRRQRPEPIAKGTTDADGKFTISNVPVGEYQVVCMVREQNLVGRERVTVEAGKTASVSLKLQVRERQGGGGGQGQHGNRGGAGGAGGGDK
jgi:hypothetical protein